MNKSLSEASIMVVEDNPDNLFILVELLRKKLKVKFVDGQTSGADLFRFLKDRPGLEIDLLLLDLQIPHEDGYAILHQIRACPRLQMARVVAVTANVMATDVERAQAAGFDGFIGKPIDRHRLTQQLTRILQDEPLWEPR